MKQKHYRIFLSSTSEDLKQQRAAIANHISHRGDIFIGMENFPPDNRTVEEYIKQRIYNSDAVLVCVGSNSGSKSNLEPEKYFVEKEVEWAREYGKLVFAYLPKTDFEGSRELSTRIQDQLHGEIMRFYESTEGILESIKVDYDSILNRLKATKGLGLIEAKDFQKFESLDGMNKSLLGVDLLCETVADISNAYKYVGRMELADDALLEFAGFTLWRTLGSMLFHDSNKELKLYYEGGSSVIHAGVALVEYLNRHHVTSHRPTDKMRISAHTNSDGSLLPYK